MVAGYQSSEKVGRGNHWNCGALIPLAASIRPPNIARMAWVITLLVAGAVLLLLETVLPGLIAGVLGLLCLIAGVIQSFVVFGPQTGSYVLMGVIVGLILGFILWARFLPDTRMGRIFTLKQTVGDDIRTERPELLNQTGSALTPLRPSGTALINGHRVDVVTEGAMIDRNTPIKVVAVEGMRVVVRALTENSVPKTT
jgi:membrane-bound serine protease (ClpP class)